MCLREMQPKSKDMLGRITYTDVATRNAYKMGDVELRHICKCNEE
jgi:hypothetical protein